MADSVIFSVDIPEEDITSIENLTKANKALREERKKLDLQSEAGRKRAQQINGQLDQNTELIKKNSSALEKQRLNIGNYSSALDKVIPGLGGATTGIAGMTKASIAFIATPMGAVIAALGLILSGIMSYLKGTEEGQHKLNKIMNIGGAIIGKLNTALQWLGEKWLKGIIYYFETLGSILSYVIPGFDDLVRSVESFLNLDTANKISELQEQEVALNRLLIVERERLRRAIEEAKLRAESTKDLKERKAALLEVESLTNQLSDKEVKLLELRRDIEIESAKQANNTIEDNDKIAESIAAVEAAEASRASMLKENETKLLAIREQEKILKQQELADQRAQDRARNVSENAEDVQIELQHKETLLTIETSFSESVNAVRNTLRKKDEENAKKALAIKKVLLAQEEEAQLQTIGAIGGLLRTFRNKNKTAAAAEALINTFLAVTRILQAPAVPFIEPFASITRGLNIASALTSGFGAIRQIQSASFATGGLTGKRINRKDGSPVYRSNGDNLLATVKVGEVILNERQQAMLGGDRTFRRLGVPGFADGGYTARVARASESRAQQREMFNLLASIRPVVLVEDINYRQQQLTDVEERANVL